MKKWLMVAVLLAGPLFGQSVIQNFEPGAGSTENPFKDIWHSVSDFEVEKVRSGERAHRFTAGKEGGTVAILVAGEKGTVDLSKAKKISIWVLDTHGDNSVELRLKDADGNGGSGQDGNSMWSKTSAKKDTWTKIEWNLADYPKSGVDLTKVSSIELFEYNPGVYYIDDVEYE
jgi:hypothetical protein